MLDYLTQPDPDLAAKAYSTIPGMAHWAGSGPPGSTCGQCQFFTDVSRGRGTSTRCNKYAQMMGGSHGPKKIPTGTAACKYFEERPKP